jgi:tetratricopeptide (TPR) repeat protein
LARLPSGYAPLYFQIAIDLRNLFFENEDPNFALKAMPYFEFASRLNPENYEILYHWAHCIYRLAIPLRTRQLLVRAEQIGELSLERSSHYPFTYLMLANIAHLEKDFKKEEKWLNTVLENEPYYFWHAHYWLTS